jgi:O-acetyl-ADP-ribose deacetylase (regulator of RNase III)
MALIQYRKGDIFESNAQVLVNTVNCKGVMGKGLALAFKQRFPDMFEVYQQECKTGKLRIGRPTLYRESTPWILNFPTKDNWKANSKIEYLEKGLEYLVSHYKEAGINSIAFPKLGTQNGKLAWDEVGPLMVRYLSNLDINVYIYIADDDIEYQDDKEAEAAIWKQFNGLALSAERLQQEVHLSARAAKKIVDSRKVVEFASLSDIIAIEGLAKGPLKQLKEYLHHQRYHVNELPGMPQEEKAVERKKQSRARRARPKKTSQPQMENIEASGGSPASLFEVAI